MTGKQKIAFLTEEYTYSMTTQFVKDAFGLGFLLWLIGYALGIALFAVLPPEVLGWVIMPVGVVITLWVLLKK